jgi:nucleolar complex protein 3
MCLNGIITVFRQDVTGEPSLEIVRLLNRMIKERGFRVHPNVLNCLVHLRLKTELSGIRASESKASKDGNDKQGQSRHRKDRKGKRNKEGTYLTKNAKKAMTETKEIRAEMEEAEAVVDREDRAHQVCEKSRSGLLLS